MKKAIIVIVLILGMIGTGVYMFKDGAYGPGSEILHSHGIHILCDEYSVENHIDNIGQDVHVHGGHVDIHNREAADPILF